MPADHRKLAASMSTAYGAVNSWIRMPPRLGPAISETDSLACRLALPSTSRSRSISSGR